MIDKSLIVILVGCIFCFINRLLFRIKISKILFENPILTNIFISLSRFLTVIPYIILTIKNKKKTINSDIENLNKSKNVEHIDKLKEVGKGKWKYILLSALIYLMSSICLTQSFKIKLNAWIWYILIAPIFYYLIFKVKLYRHHYLSIVLIILTGLVIDLIIDAFQSEILDDIHKLIMKFLKQILFSL